jgi:hypothetical protein
MLPALIFVIAKALEVRPTKAENTRIFANALLVRGEYLKKSETLAGLVKKVIKENQPENVFLAGKQNLLLVGKGAQPKIIVKNV